MIFICERERERETSGKIPTKVPMESSVVGSALHCRTWGTWSHINLMKACLGCQSVRSMYWAVKKVPVQVEMMYDNSGAIVVTSKSSFLLKEPKRRILRGYCRGDRPNSMYLGIYWVGGLI